jgi:hypothetical protein
MWSNSFQLTVKSRRIRQMLALHLQMVYEQPVGGVAVEPSTKYVQFSFVVWPQSRVTEQQQPIK